MKHKIGFIAIALITVLATLGIGFSMWSQLITINGNVNTGNVSLTVGNPTGEWAYKDETPGVPGQNNVGYLRGPTNGSDGPNLSLDTWYCSNPSYPTYLSMANPVLIAWSYAIINNNNSVTMYWYNLYPTTGHWLADFDLTNTSSIPVIFHVTSATLTPSNVGNGGDPPTISVKYGNDPSLVGAGDDLPLAGTQWDPAQPAQPYQTIHVAIEVAGGESMAQGYSGSFTVYIQAVQWNEYNGNPTQTQTP